MFRHMLLSCRGCSCQDLGITKRSPAALVRYHLCHSNTTSSARSALGSIWASQPLLQRFCPAFVLLFSQVQLTSPPWKEQFVLDSFSISIYWFLDPSSSFSCSFWILVLPMRMPGGSICNLYELPFISSFKPWKKISSKTKPKRAFLTLLFLPSKFCTYLISINVSCTDSVLCMRIECGEVSHHLLKTCSICCCCPFIHHARHCIKEN